MRYPRTRYSHHYILKQHSSSNPYSGNCYCMFQRYKYLIDDSSRRSLMPNVKLSFRGDIAYQDIVEKEIIKVHPNHHYCYFSTQMIIISITFTVLGTHVGRECSMFSLCWNIVNENHSNSIMIVIIISLCEH